MQKADAIVWPKGREDLLAVRIALPSPCTLNQTALMLGGGEEAVFLTVDHAPIVVAESTTDLSFEVDGFASALAQLFYSREYRGEVWLVRTGVREVAWAMDLGGRAVSGTLSFQAHDAAALAGTADGDAVTWEALGAWVRQAWEDGFAPVAQAVTERAPDDGETWEEAASETELRVAKTLASRGVKLFRRGAVVFGEGLPAAAAAPGPAITPPTAEECLVNAMELVADLQGADAITFAEGMVPEQASVALADRLLVEGCRVDAAGAARIWAILQDLPGVLLMISWEDFASRVEQVEA